LYKLYCSKNEKRAVRRTKLCFVPEFAQAFCFPTFAKNFKKIILIYENVEQSENFKAATFLKNCDKMKDDFQILFHSIVKKIILKIFYSFCKEPLFLSLTPNTPQEWKELYE
jgi:hypothetical protein